MGFRFRKSKKIGPFRITMSKSGISYSAGVKGFRVTKTASGRVRTTASIPGTGISYVKESGRKADQANVARSIPSQQEVNTSPPITKKHVKSVSLTDLEEAIVSLEKQIALLEEQRKTLVFSNPVEEAEADRRLADLKLRHADSVVAFRKLQASASPAPDSVVPPAATEPIPAAVPQAPAPRQRGTNWLTPLIGILILVAAIAASAFSRKAPEPVAPALPVITSEVQPMTVDELHARFLRALEAEMSGHYSLAVDKDAHTITCDIWFDGFDAVAVNTALRSRDYLQRWNTNTAEICELCNDMQGQVVNHGHDEYAVTVRLVNCEDLGQVFAVAERGALVYDVVEDTPPGGEIPDPTKRVRSSETSETYGNYVLNLYSKVIHTTDCQYAPQLFEHWRSEYNGMYDDLIAGGYRPCKICNPGSN